MAVAGFFDLLDSGEQSLKGASVPVRVFELRRPGQIGSRLEIRSSRSSFRSVTGAGRCARRALADRTRGRRATRDALSQGRLIVGVGVGWWKEELEILGAVFQQRGRQADEALYPP